MTFFISDILHLKSFECDDILHSYKAVPCNVCVFVCVCLENTLLDLAAYLRSSFWGSVIGLAEHRSAGLIEITG